MIARVALVALLLAGTAEVAHAQGMLSSRHNLSASGLFTVKAVTETQICVFCHTPHNANPGAPLWNRNLNTGSTYDVYASGTLQAAVRQPNGYARLCLSCHDGTIAIGSVHNIGGQSTTLQMQGTGTGGVMPAGRTLLGTILTNDHPVSFVFNSSLASADGELVAPSDLALPGSKIRLYEGENAGTRDSVQCTTCHDPHLTVNPKFLRKSFTGKTDNLCLTCHVKPGWSGSSHESATTKFFGGTAVSELSCSACHHPHTDQGAPRLLRSAIGATAPAIEQTCFRCHQSTASGGITFDLSTQFAKSGSLHRITAYSGHEPVFTTANPPEAVLNTAKHVECTDCHNPHRVRARRTTGTGGVYEGMRGIDVSGAVVQDVTVDRNLIQYEVCFRCHSDSYATAIGSTVQGYPSGTIPTSNKRTEFQTTNSSFHPVPGAGHNTSQNLGSQLQGGLTTSSTIECTDCHNNEFFSGPSYLGPVSQYGANEAQPKGPHGSTNTNLLRARYWNILPGPTKPSAQSQIEANFAVCFQCHNATKLLDRKFSTLGGQARTNFYDSINGKDNLHWLHLFDRADKVQAVCKDCHYNIHSNVEASNTTYDVFGVQTSSPNTTLGSIPTTRLVNFRPTVIGAISGAPKPRWWINSSGERRCYLVCHTKEGNAGGATMNGFQYRPPCGDVTPSTASGSC